MLVLHFPLCDLNTTWKLYICLSSGHNPVVIEIKSALSEALCFFLTLKSRQLEIVGTLVIFSQEEGGWYENLHPIKHQVDSAHSVKSQLERGASFNRPTLQRDWLMCLCDITAIGQRIPGSHAVGEGSEADRQLTGFSCLEEKSFFSMKENILEKK